MSVFILGWNLLSALKKSIFPLSPLMCRLLYWGARWQAETGTRWTAQGMQKVLGLATKEEMEGLLKEGREKGYLKTQNERNSYPILPAHHKVTPDGEKFSRRQQPPDDEMEERVYLSLLTLIADTQRRLRALPDIYREACIAEMLRLLYCDGGSKVLGKYHEESLDGPPFWEEKERAFFYATSGTKAYFRALVRKKNDEQNEVWMEIKRDLPDIGFEAAFAGEKETVAKLEEQYEKHRP